MTTLLINFNRVAEGRRFYRNEHGHARQQCPKFATCCNDQIPDDMVNKYRERQRLDHWHLVVRFDYSASHHVEIKGTEAEQYWAAYAAFIFSKKTKVG